MALEFGKNETVVKTYTYSKKTASGKTKGEYQASLIVTDKRIISETQSKDLIYRKEMSVMDADFVSCSYATKKRSLVGAVVAFLLGVAVIAAGFLVDVVSFLRYVGIIGIVVGVILVILYFALRKAGVQVSISGGSPEYEVMNLGASTLSSGKDSQNRQVSVTVDRETAILMVNELGATIQNAKELHRLAAE